MCRGGEGGGKWGLGSSGSSFDLLHALNDLLQAADRRRSCCMQMRAQVLEETQNQRGKHHANGTLKLPAVSCNLARISGCALCHNTQHRRVRVLNLMHQSAAL